jgi:Protein of unknown function (DUF4232)
MSQDDHGQRSGAAAAMSVPGQRSAGGPARLCVALVALCCVVGVVIARPSASLGSTTPRCSTSNLILGFVRQLGAAGTTGWDLSLRNGGPATCHLNGFPGVGLLDGSARLIHVSVDRHPGFKAQNVVLHPWQRAYLSLTYHTGGKRSACTPHYFSAYGLQVIPPNSTQRLLYYHGRFDVCNPSFGHPSVYPVRPTLNLKPS